MRTDHGSSEGELDPVNRPRSPSGFEELLARLRDRFTVDADVLSATLFAIRAPHDLVGIVPCCQYIEALARSFPEFASEPAFADQGERLRVVHEIAQLHIPSKEGSSLGARRVKQRQAPTYGMDASSPSHLLLASRPWNGLPTEPAVLVVHAWFAWQVMQHQARNESLADYRAYLFGRDWPRRPISEWGPRLAAASRSLRRLIWDARLARVLVSSDAARALAQLATLAELMRPFTPERSFEMLAVLTKFFGGQPDLLEHSSATLRLNSYDSMRAIWVPRLAAAFPERMVREQIPLAVDPSQHELNFSRSVDPGSAGQGTPPVSMDRASSWVEHHEPPPYLPELGRFLEVVWTMKAPAKRTGGRRGRQVVPLQTITVERYVDVTTVSQPVDGDGVQDGIAVDLYPAPEEPEVDIQTRILGAGPKHRHADGTAGHHRIVWNDDPDTEPAIEPPITLFLLTGSATSGWYAARSMAHHIELKNAWLQWPDWRLSDAAIKAVLAWVAHDGEVQPGALWARLALGLSLVSGRSLSAACDAEVADSEAMVRRGALRIDVARRLLVVRAGAPDLQSLAPGTVETYCTPHIETLSLPLPEAWTPLLDHVAGHDLPPLDVRREAVERALTAFPVDATITQKGIGNALKLALLDRGRGDLGLVKAITDADDANLTNIIHYASYDQGAAERHWRSIVHDWAGPLHVAASSPQPTGSLVQRAIGSDPSTTVMAATAHADARVGTPYSVDPAQVAPHIAALKQRFREALAAARWADVNNLLTLYVAVWLGLATAGRTAAEPAPGVILRDGWALVRDKHRADESTDRYVPLGDGIQAQLQVLRNLTAVLSLGNDAFAPPHVGADHVLNLRLVGSDGKVVPFHPADLADSDVLRGLPGNWARKVVRGFATELPGRFLDAGLGHWVRGRHPWTLTSTFPAVEFRDRWLAVQTRFERELGLEVLEIPGLPGYGAVSVTPAPTRSPEGAAESAFAENDDGAGADGEDPEVQALLENCHGDLWYDRVFKQQPPDRNAALALAKWAIGHTGGKLGGDLTQVATRVCTHIRMRSKVPLFAMRPRGRFQHNWLVNRREFEAAAYVERQLLPTIRRDLQRLPSLEYERTELARRATDAAHQSGIWRKLRAGRLMAVLALRAGLVTTPHLEAMLRMLAGDRPLLAIGDTRAVQLDVVSRRATDPMSRTVLLDPYVAALVACERDAVRPWLRHVLRDAQADRYAEHWNAALRVYLRSLGLPADITLAMYLAGIRQRIQLASTPLLAAYASGEILTQDLSLHELARLAGCELPDALQQPSERTSPGMYIGTAARPADPSDYWTSRERFRAATLAAEEPRPADVVASDADLPDRLLGKQDESPDDWLRHIELARRQVHHLPLARLLCAFATDLVRTYQNRSGHRDEVNRKAEARLGHAHGFFDSRRPPRTELSQRFCTWARSHLRIVWTGLAGFGSTAGDHPCIDELVVQALAEGTESYFPARRQRAAWSRFRSFLANPNADHAGFAVGSIDTDRLRPVSAKLLSHTELDRAAAYLGSVRSGLGATATRSVACRHFELIRATGARRAEAAQLRWVDVDGDSVRIRAYAGHTLKTPASERVIPTLLLSRKTWLDLQNAKGTNADQPVMGGQVTGANFFDAEARAIKYGGRDADLGPHHLRHTKANALLLKVLGNCVGVGLLSRDFPWVTSMLPPDAELATLLGRGGQCGQGLQAISMLLGHLHPTTTLKHYIHTLCLALHAYQLGQASIPLHRAFGNRVHGRAALYRHAQHEPDPAKATRYTLNRVESDAERWHRVQGCRARLVVAAVPRTEQGSLGSHGGVVAVKPTEPTGAERHGGMPAPGWTVAELEGWQRFFTTGKGAAPSDADALRSALHMLAMIPSGKHGSRTARHPLPTVGRDGLRLPATIESDSEALHAQQLLDWMALLHRDRPSDFEWLLDKWARASEVQEGLMRLDDREAARAKSLPRILGVVPEIRAGHVAAKRVGSGAVAGARLRIQFTRRGDSRLVPPPETHVVPDGTPAGDTTCSDTTRRIRYAGRTTGVVRWVLTWLTVRCCPSALCPPSSPAT